MRTGRGRRALLTAVALAAVLGGAWGAVNSPLFRARSIEVNGAERLSRAEVLAIAELDARTNVLRLSPSGVERRLESAPMIADATVSRRPPSTVVVEIRERVPVAVARAGKAWATLASDGVVLELRSGKPPLPQVHLDLPVARTRVGASIDRRRDALALLERLPPVIDVAAVEPDGGAGWRLRLADGTRVLYGPVSAWRAKNEVLASILGWADRQGTPARFIDVRLPDAPAVTLR